MKQYGLLGRSLQHSFSKHYFTDKFAREGVDAAYELYELELMEQLPALLTAHELEGLNVTIPYKEEIITYLDALDPVAREVGAVNVVKFERSADQLILKGYNTDVVGFIESIRPAVQAHHHYALVLGTGGASKAIKYGLEQLGMQCTYVSRTPSEGEYAYADLTAEVMARHTVIVNATPLGMFPHVDTCPDILYHCLTAQHLLFDAVYNPALTKFLQLGRDRGAVCLNGGEMLRIQAEAAWAIWNDKLK